MERDLKHPSLETKKLKGTNSILSDLLQECFKNARRVPLDEPRFSKNWQYDIFLAFFDLSETL